MSDTTATPADIAPRGAEPAQAGADATTDWKAEAEHLRTELQKARKWEALAKENKAAADQLASQKTEAEKVAERLAEVEKRAAEAESRAVRRDVALEFGLSKEDAALLDAVNGEEAMRSLAQRLSTESDKRKKQGNTSPREGNTPKTGTEDEKREFARNLFARGQAT